MIGQKKMWKYVKFMHIYLCVVLGMLILPQSVWAKNKADNQFLIFKRLADGQYTISVSINESEPLIFMVDTGASRTSRKLNIPKSNLTYKTVRGMTRAQKRPTINLTQLEFASQSYENRTVVVLEDWEYQEGKLDGILGMDVLSGLILSFTHDQKKPRSGSLQILTRHKLKALKYRDWTVVKLEKNPYPNAEYGLLFIDTYFGNLRIPTLFDTGSSFSAISWNIVEGTKLGEDKKRLRKEWIIQGAVGEFKPRIRIKIDGIKIGGIRLDQYDLLVMDFDALPLNHQGKFPLVIVGVDYINGQDFILDLKTKRLLLNRHI
ncbi:MAG: hypothetical protein COA43_09305 [Robiginitomaculum sp.]|nr:MAG: hypothetical protein COA43_09305 [Robiginitomaculum sp.]